MTPVLALAVSPTVAGVIAVAVSLFVGFVVGAAAGASTVRDLDLRAKLMRGVLARISRGTSDPSTLALDALAQDDVIRGAVLEEARDAMD